jgi:hypothetical protein
MRLQDELVALHAIADASTRRYILGQVARLPVHFDAAELAELLERGALDSERVVSGRAIAAWDRTGARLIAHGYGLDPGRMGLWSTLAAQVQGGGAPAAPIDADANAPDAGAQRAALATVLEPARAKLFELAARADRVGTHARQVLALVPFAGAEDVLIEGAGDPGRAIGALLALARRDPKLAITTARDNPRVAPWMRATVAGAVGGKTGLALALDVVKTGDAHALWALAEALPEFAGEAWAELARQLAMYRSGWVPVVLADALGQLAPDATALSILDDVLKKAGHDLARIIAIKAMGGFPGELAPKRAMKCLERGSPLLQAAAIECLARLDHRPPQLTDLLAQRAAAGPLKLRGTAILGLMVFDPSAALRHGIELASATEPASRVEGAFVLGYLKSPAALQLLNVLARRDPFVPAALQAEKSLAHFPEEQAAPGLTELLAHPQTAIAHSALRVLSHYPGDAQAGVLPAIEALEKKSAGDAAEAVLRECGLLGPSVANITDYLSRPRADAKLRAAALEGLARSGEVPAELAGPAAAEADPALAVPGALAQLVAGDDAGAAALAKWLGDERASAAAMRAVRDLAVIAGEAGRGGRHARLARLLARRATGRVKPLAQAPSRPSKPIAVAAPPPTSPPPAPVPSQPSMETKAAVEKLAGALKELASRTGAQKRPDWAKELTYLHGPSSFFEQYRTLLPAVVIVGLIVLFFVGQTLRHTISPEQSAVVVRDNLIGKVGTPVELTGKVTALQPEKRSFHMMKDGKVAVRVWSPSVDVKALKVGVEVQVSGTVKDLRANPPVVHGFTVKE